MKKILLATILAAAVAVGGIVPSLAATSKSTSMGHKTTVQKKAAPAKTGKGPSVKAHKGYKKHYQAKKGAGPTKKQHYGKKSTTKKAPTSKRTMK